MLPGQILITFRGRLFTREAGGGFCFSVMLCCRRRTTPQHHKFQMITRILVEIFEINFILTLMMGVPHMDNITAMDIMV